jgi:AbrB family looped-hinge helix DNA binding protein
MCLEKGAIMSLVKVKKNAQITLPNGLRKKYHIVEGDYVDIGDKKGEIFIKPVKVMLADEAYFHSKEWQDAETEADKDIAEGKVFGPFSDAEACIKSLES